MNDVLRELVRLSNQSRRERRGLYPNFPVKVIALNVLEPSQMKRRGFLTGQVVVPTDFNRVGSAEIEQLFGL
ncbi:hypothetical protein [Candidatus Cyanaurora vandensis]|uniref:hypothetical protein n=1 Tax=Candidatus Cyanaurora vandensis TaxID=2714958 RepID=UPI0037C14995